MLIPTRFPIPLELLAAVPFLIGQFAIISQKKERILERFEPTNDVPYDFIVVGGGSAGCVVAARLSENPAHSVLLLEAGGNPNPFSFVPFSTPFLQNHPATDWKYKTVPINDTNSQKPLFWPRGKGLGGSSATNFMIYMRGNPKDFNDWANITGDPRWGYSNVAKYFKRMEDYHGIYKGDTQTHGKNGPLRVEPITYAPGLSQLLDAVEETGYVVRDLNADQQEGFSPMEFTQRRGRRLSAYSAYIQPILWRPNLKILRYSQVTQVHFDSNLRATGVSFFRDGKSISVRANKEVILCGGTINSAQLLLLSGVGPSEHLQSVGINPLVELPVGRNLIDHVATFVGPFILNKRGTPRASFTPRDLTYKSWTNFAINGAGPLTIPMGLIGIGVTSSSSSPGWPNLLYFFSSLGVFDGLGAAIDGIVGSDDDTQSFLHPFIGHDAHFVSVALGKPESRGFIQLFNKNPLAKPMINPQYYSDGGNQDIQDMIEGYQTVVKLYEKSNSLGNKLGARLAKIPACAKYTFKTRDYYECAIRTAIRTVFHPVGTCAMGKVGDAHAVVDPQLRVIGTKGLRVIDASVMPTITNANTNSPTIMIGEVGADLIKYSHLEN